MIPISDDNPVEHTPFMTLAIIFACVAVFVWELSLGSRGMEGAQFVYGFVPAAYFGYVNPPSELIGLPAVATIFTSMFLHGGFLHIAGNMLYLWIFGNNIEEAMGHVKFTLFYLASGVCAALTMGLIDTQTAIPMVGASGAISGVLGAYMLLYPRARVHVIIPLGIIFYPLWVRAVWVVGVWFLMQLAAALYTDPGQPGTAFWAHVGGFAAGLLMTPMLKKSDVRYFGPYFRARRPWG
ncbi:MAG: rhomboid family intramembrane serine protease [Alphaproteobacteria bacterium]|nr:rhomboid family intramembrane serine protease [Alphaproteobacteria bacterium]MBV9693348.1 rhomboid family intramembrane serine protease [Alphaproteobacteria bacterium]